MKGEKGVSPVIATMVLIAVTVVAAAAVIAYIATMGAPPAAQPTVLAPELYDNTGENDYLLVRHRGGSDVSITDIVLKVDVDNGDTLSILGSAFNRTGDIVDNILSAGETTSIYQLTGAPNDFDEGELYRVAISHTPSLTVLYDTKVRAKAA
jgi:flagellin-like protein